MTAIEQAANLLPDLSRAEKAQLLQWAARDLGDAFSGIESTAGVCGREPCIRRTRIQVWLLEQSRRFGMSEVELPGIFPTLCAEDIVNGWAYIQAHRPEIDGQIRDNEAA